MLLNRKKRRGMSPIISTLLIMVTTMFALSFTVSFVQSSLSRRENENDYEFAKVFMNTVGLQMDEVAWRPSQRESIQYTSQYAELYVREVILRYEIIVKHVGSTNETIITTIDCNGLFFSIPVSRYSLGNDYFANIQPDSMISLVQMNTTSPIVRVFAVQKNPIVNENDYIRIGIVPLIRGIPFSITSGVSKTNYLKLFIVRINKGTETGGQPKTIALTGVSVNAQVFSDVEYIKVNLSFPKGPEGYSNEFFRFPETSQIINYGSEGVNLELYVGALDVGYETR